MARTAITADNLIVFGGGLYHRPDPTFESEGDIVCDYFIGLVIDGRYYIYSEVYRHRYDADVMMKKILDYGSVNLDKWEEQENPYDIEEELGEYGFAWQEEQNERNLWGSYRY